MLYLVIIHFQEVFARLPSTTSICSQVSSPRITLPFFLHLNPSCSSDLSGHQILLNAFPDLPDHISSPERLYILITCPLLYGLHKSMQFNCFIIICPCPLQHRELHGARNGVWFCSSS